jgi:hypothetical protein
MKLEKGKGTEERVIQTSEAGERMASEGVQQLGEQPRTCDES